MLSQAFIISFLKMATVCKFSVRVRLEELTHLAVKSKLRMLTLPRKKSCGFIPLPKDRSEITSQGNVTLNICGTKIYIQ